MADPSALSMLQRKLHTCQVLLWLKQTYRIQGKGKCDFILSKELVYQAYLAMSAAHQDLAEGERHQLPPLTRPVLGKMVKRAFPSVPSIRRGPRGRVKQLYVGLVPRTHSPEYLEYQRAKKKKIKKQKQKMEEEEEEEEEEYESTTTEVGIDTPTQRLSENEEEEEDCDSDGRSEELENRFTTTTTTTTTDEEQMRKRRYSIQTSSSSPTTTSPTPPNSSSSSYSRGGICDLALAAGSSLESTTASSTSSPTTTTTPFFLLSSSPPSSFSPGAALGSPLRDNDPRPGVMAYQGPEVALNGRAGAGGCRDCYGQRPMKPKLANMTDWARRAARLGRNRAIMPTGDEATGGCISLVAWAELIIPADRA